MLTVQQTCRMKRFRYIFLLGFLCCLAQTIASGQGSFRIGAGFGIPELLNAGLGYSTGQLQLGVSVGSMPVKDERIISILGDIRYHFAGRSAYTHLRPWFARLGVNYMRDEIQSKIDCYVYLNARIGREFNLSTRVGIDLDAGAIFQLVKNETRKTPPPGWSLNIHFPVFLSFGTGVFYRF